MNKTTPIPRRQKCSMFCQISSALEKLVIALEKLVNALRSNSLENSSKQWHYSEG